MGIHFEIAGSQIDGAREYQEDSFLTTYVDDDSGAAKATGLVIMADGMGGHAAGNIASNLAVSTFNKALTAHFGKEPPPVALRSALMQANDALKSSIRETPALDGMGCTMVSAIFTSGKVWWVSVGDSHLYVIRQKSLDKKNEDHSYGGYLDRMKAAGMEVEAEAGLSRNMLMSAMTGDEIVEIDCPREPFELKNGDRILIASDGLDTLSHGTLVQLAEWSKTPKDYVEALLNAVEEAAKPRQDNTTVVVVDAVGDGEDEVDMELSMDDILGEDATEMDADEDEITQPGAEAELVDLDELEGDEDSGRGKLIAIIIAALILVLAAGGAAWYFLGGDSGQQSATPPPPVQPAPVPQPAPTPTVQPTPAPTQPAPSPVPTPQPAPQPAPVPQVAPAPTPAPAPQASDSAEFRDTIGGEIKGPLMVKLPAGEFRMGSPGFSVAQDERPRHDVKVRAFAMSKYEITYAEYKVFTDATGRKMPNVGDLDAGTYPVTSVSWDDALAYVNWLSDQTGEVYRLPSEAEWEYAAAANSDAPYSWGYEFEMNRAHCFRCTRPAMTDKAPVTIGYFSANAFGLHDTAGNVAEWVEDCYHNNYQGAPSSARVWKGGDCKYRMVRGGSYDSPSPSVKRTKRDKRESMRGYDNIGIRIARDL